MNKRFSVAVFGSANLIGPEVYHAQIEQLGYELAKHDIDIFVGSTTGLIERFLRGANHQAKQTHINLVAYGDKRYMSTDNVDQLMLEDSYFSRLAVLCECSVFIVLDGQLGTMAETMVTWNRLQASMDFKRKIIVFGQSEQKKIRFLLDEFVFSKQAYRELVTFADDVDGILAVTFDGDQAVQPC